MVRITWSNSCGPLAEVTAAEGEDAARQLAAMILDCGVVNAGDRFSVEEIEAEAMAA